ncbi:MAG TPA: hypothetical protein VFW40_14520 [Capsulimonadaceae bacterium]|nr:hypothetical protein [Capsulimonadaceae bacterium]
MRKGIVLAIGGLALAFLAGCGYQGDKASNIPVQPKWKGPAYRIAVDTQPVKPNPTGVTIPVIKFTANPDALETRATLVVRFDASELSKGKADGPMMNKMIMAPVDIHGAEGALPKDYMEAGSKDLSTFLGAYCIKGKVKISVALARSSLTNRAGDAEVDNKRLSDWLPIEVAYKNAHPKC